MEEEYQYFVGLDGGWKDYKVCICDKTGKVEEEWVAVHNGDELAQLADRLSEVSGGRPESVAVAIEVTVGAVVETLLERGFHVYHLNPKKLDRFRDRHSVAGAKDDRLDAFVMADSLRTDRKRFQRLKNDDPLTIELRGVVRIDIELRDEVVRLANQLTEQVHRYFPQFLEFGSLADQPWLWDLLELMPTPEKARSVRPRTIAALLKNRRIRRITARRVSAILKKKPLVLAPGAVEAAASHVGYLLPRLKLAYGQRVECGKHMEQLLKRIGESSDGAQDEGSGERHEHRDVQVILSYPGLGTRIAATMLAEAAEPLSRRSYRDLRAYGGMAPVTRQSGKQRAVLMRRACNGRLRDALHHWARVCLQNDNYSKEHYERLRGAGHSHARALRGVADRLIKTLCAMLRTRTLYDPALRGCATASA